MSVERFTLDTNILIYSVDSQAGWQQHVAAQIIERAALADCWLTLQSLSEFYAASTRKRLAAPKQAAEVVNVWLDMFPILPASETAVRRAVALASIGRASYWDGLLVATAAEAGCTVLLTEDMTDGDTLQGVRILNPFADGGLAPAAHALLAAE